MSADAVDLLPTGRPIALELGDVRADIGTVAAVLRSLSVGGHDLVHRIPDDEAPGLCAGIVFSPWPSRVRAGRWVLDGAVQQLDITEPARGGALHGLLQFTDYAVIQQTDAAVTLAATLFPQHGWPFHLDTWVRYELTPDGLIGTHGVTNRSDSRAPYATGAHPYLRVGDTPIAELELTVVAESYVELDERLDAVRELPVEGGPFDVRSARSLSELDVDTSFGTLSPVNELDGRGDVAWLTAPNGSRTTLSQDLAWGWVHVFTTRLLPTQGRLIEAVGVEPMTAPPNALNSGQDLRWIEPGASWEGSWRLRYAGGHEGE